MEAPQMIDPKIVESVDRILDRDVSEHYQEQPLAQHWARVAKVQEELGEAIAELILWTGQNPRKSQDDSARRRLLLELADTAMTGIYAIQHFTKDVEETARYIKEAQTKHITRLTAIT